MANASLMKEEKKKQEASKPKTRAEMINYQQLLLIGNDARAMRKLREGIKLRYPHIVLAPAQAITWLPEGMPAVGEKRLRGESQSEVIEDGVSLPVISSDAKKR